MAARKGNKYAVGNKGGGVRAVEVKDLPALALKMLAWFDSEIKNGSLPHLSRFARKEVGIDEETLLNYTSDDEVFFGAYKKCKQIQKEFIIDQTLAGKYNPTFAIFTAKNMTDMRDERHVKADVNVNKLLSETYDEL